MGMVKVGCRVARTGGGSLGAAFLCEPGKATTGQSRQAVAASHGAGRKPVPARESIAIGDYCRANRDELWSGMRWKPNPGVANEPPAGEGAQTNQGPWQAFRGEPWLVANLAPAFSGRLQERGPRRGTPRRRVPSGW